MDLSHVGRLFISQTPDSDFARFLECSTAGMWIGRSVSRLVGRSVGMSVGRSVAMSVGTSVGRHVNRSVDRSVGRSVSPSPLNVFHYNSYTFARIGTKIWCEG